MHSNGDAGTFAQTSQSHSRYPATSSAFSASAHPHEDWTKISDLAERRRIQNRIAQRNYRKKLKKRLEDLERKAASSSASPEQQPAQLQRQKSPRKKATQAQTPPVSLDSSRESSRFSQLPTADQRAGFLPLPDGALFSEQYTRQLSTSPPPPFSYPMSSQESLAYAPYPTQLPYSSVSPSFSDSTAYSYSPFPATYPAVTSTVEYPPKTDFYPEVDLHSFSFSYAAIPSIEIPSGQPFGDSIPQTPPLSECHELYCAASPPESSFLPQTPATFAASPRLAMV